MKKISKIILCFVSTLEKHLESNQYQNLIFEIRHIRTKYVYFSISVKFLVWFLHKTMTKQTMYLNNFARKSGFKYLYPKFFLFFRNNFNPFQDKSYQFATFSLKLFYSSVLILVLKKCHYIHNWLATRENGHSEICVNCRHGSAWCRLIRDGTSRLH